MNKADFIYKSSIKDLKKTAIKQEHTQLYVYDEQPSRVAHIPPVVQT